MRNERTFGQPCHLEDLRPWIELTEGSESLTVVVPLSTGMIVVFLRLSKISVE